MVSEDSDPARVVAHTLAAAPRPLLMRDIIQAAERGSGMRLTTPTTGRILRAMPMFKRLQNGRWQVGYQAVPLEQARLSALAHGV